MTILEAIYSFYRIHCEICKSYFELSAKNYTRFEAARILVEVGWQVINNTVLCPSCVADWQREQDEANATPNEET